jgi:membrane protein DedA with SNARE-associated domain
MSDLGALLTAVFSRVGDEHVGWVTLGVGCVSLVEHLFPPIPGDLIVALGLALAFAKGWHIVPVFLAAMAGGLIGSCVMYGFGHWLASRDPVNDGPRVARFRATVRPIVDSLLRRSVLAIVVSRFVPVGRAMVIVAAGYGKLPMLRAMIAATTGLLLWNGALTAIAALVGTHHEKISRILSLYGRVVYALLAVALVGWILRRWRRRRGIGERGE